MQNILSTQVKILQTFFLGGKEGYFFTHPVEHILYAAILRDNRQIYRGGGRAYVHAIISPVAEHIRVKNAHCLTTPRQSDWTHRTSMICRMHREIRKSNQYNAMSDLTVYRNRIAAANSLFDNIFNLANNKRIHAFSNKDWSIGRGGIILY